MAFQSSPLVAEGRDAGMISLPPSDFVFQSSPLVAEGRDSSHQGPEAWVSMFQSSPLVAEGRDLPGMRIHPAAARCFNPRPRCLRGAT